MASVEETQTVLGRLSTTKYWLNLGREQLRLAYDAASLPGEHAMIGSIWNQLDHVVRRVEDEFQHWIKLHREAKGD